MAELISRYYVWLSSLTRWLTPPISHLDSTVNILLVSTLLFGPLGAVAPCQLSTNMAALPYPSRTVSDPRQLWRQTVAFIASKATVYLLLGGIIAGLGLQIDQLTPTI